MQGAYFRAIVEFVVNNLDPHQESISLQILRHQGEKRTNENKKCVECVSFWWTSNTETNRLRVSTVSLCQAWRLFVSEFMSQHLTIRRGFGEINRSTMWICTASISNSFTSDGVEKRSFVLQNRALLWFLQKFRNRASAL